MPQLGSSYKWYNIYYMTSDEQHIKNYGQIFTPRYIVVV